MVRPVVEYASSVWDPHTAKDCNEIEKVQRRAARYVLNRHQQKASVSSMLQELNWPSLEDRRKHARLAMMYRINEGSVAIHCPVLQPSPSNPSYRTRNLHPKQYQRIQTRTDYRKFSFFPRTICDWNALPTDTAMAPSLNAFKRKVLRDSN